MHDLSFFRNNFERVAERLASRGPIPSLDRFRELDRARRAAISQSEQLKAAANAESAEIGKLRRQGEDTTARQERVRRMKEQIAGLDDQVKSLEAEFHELLAGIPNIPHESVPVGRDSEDNVEVRRVGEPRQFDFEPKAHWDLGADLGILDLERAAKISGAPRASSAPANCPSSRTTCSDARAAICG